MGTTLTVAPKAKAPRKAGLILVVVVVVSVVCRFSGFVGCYSVAFRLLCCEEQQLCVGHCDYIQVVASQHTTPNFSSQQKLENSSNSISKYTTKQQQNRQQYI